MPAKKKPTITNDEKELHVAYAGMIETGKHEYRVVGTEDSFIFAKKLHYRHVVGFVYPIFKVNDKQFRVDQSKYIQPLGEWENTQDIVEWTQRDSTIKRHIKAKSESSKLITEVRKIARALRPMYQRANGLDKASMLRAFVEEIEKIE